MARRSKKPDEALGPALDGLKLLEEMPPSEEPPLEEVPEPSPEPEEAPEVVEHPVALLCGQGVLAEAVGALAEACGFIVEYAVLETSDETPPPAEEQIHRLAGTENFVENCGIDRNFFVGIFFENLEDCEAVLQQCLSSHAAYIGIWADHEKRREIFAHMRDAGVPDAELAALHCPIGLNLGASTFQQMAVGIVAEMLAAKNGTMQRLIYEE